MQRLASLKNDPIYRLVYYSAIMLPFGDPRAIGMLDLVARARRRNAALGITGILYSDDAYFSQLLEGPRDSVEAVFASIRRDSRHRDIVVTEQGPQPARAFDGWALELVCDARASAAIGTDEHDVSARTNNPDAFAALMSYVVAKVPAGWSAPPGP